MSTTSSDSPARGRRFTARDLALVAAFAALIAALSLPGSLPIVAFGLSATITAQTLGVMLAGSILGPWRGAAAVLTCLALVAVGLPALPPSKIRPQAGLAVFTSPAGGYMIGWILAAVVIGLLVAYRPARFSFAWILVANILGGMVAVYAVGIPWMAALLPTSLVHAAEVNVVYLPGDVLKAVASAVVTGAVIRGYPGIVPGPRGRGTAVTDAVEAAR